MKTDFEGTQRTETDENIVSDRVNLTQICVKREEMELKKVEKSQRDYILKNKQNKLIHA